MTPEIAQGGEEKRPPLYRAEQILLGKELPVRGRNLIEKLRAVEIGEYGGVGEIISAVERTRAYLEGLPSDKAVFLDFDPSKLDDSFTRQKVAFLRDLFLTTEGSSRRPDAPYVSVEEQALIDRLMIRLSDAFIWRNDEETFVTELKDLIRRQGLSGEQINDAVEEEERFLARAYLAAEKILALSNYVEARESIDGAFRQRMATCENPEQASKLGGEIRAISPDGPTWETLFKTERLTDYGKKVDELWLEILKFGLSSTTCQRLGLDPVPDNIRAKVCKGHERGVFADGFKDTESFAYFLKYLLEKSEGRLDVVWGAWRLFLLWEVPSDMGVYIDDKGKYVISAPPISNSLLIITANLDEVRRREFGVDSAGNRTQVEKFVNKSGLPITIGKIPDLCHGFLRETKISFGKDHLAGQSPFKEKLKQVLERVRDKSANAEDYEEVDDLSERVGDFLEGKSESVSVSLWDLRLYGGWSFSDPSFPWVMTDQTISQESESGEVPSGAFGAWLLKRSRSFGLLSNKEGSGVLDIPRLDSLADQGFYLGSLRNWSKVLGSVKEKDLPEKNPRAWLLLVWLIYYKPGLPTDLSPIEKEKYWAAGFRSPRNVTWIKAEAYVERGVSLGQILSQAIATGWIRREDANWIQSKLGVNVGKW